MKQRQSNRLKEYDYSTNGFYFVTICIKDRINIFGNIEDSKIILNECGNIAHNYWVEIPNHFENIQLDEFVVMPNHIHGIIIIDNEFHTDDIVGNRHACSLRNETTIEKIDLPGRQNEITGNGKSIDGSNIIQHNVMNVARNRRACSLQGRDQIGASGNTDDPPHASSLQNKDRQHQTLPVIIGSYKSSVSRAINKMHKESHFQWQKSYYDHVIRNDKSLNAIRKYIVENPLRWELDIENKECKNNQMQSKLYYEKIFYG